MGQVLKKKMNKKAGITFQREVKMNWRKGGDRWYQRQHCKRAGREPIILPSNCSGFGKVLLDGSPSGGNHVLLQHWGQQGPERPSASSSCMCWSPLCCSPLLPGSKTRYCTYFSPQCIHPGLCLPTAWLSQLAEVSGPCLVGHHIQLVSIRHAGLDAGHHVLSSAQHGVLTPPSSPPALLRWELGNWGNCRVSRDFWIKFCHRVWPWLSEDITP